MLSLIKALGSISNGLVRNYHSHSPRIVSSFKLDDSFLEKKREEGRKHSPFGYNGLGEFVYRRTYAREGEEWTDTVNRVVSGTMRMYEPYLVRASGYQNADQKFLQDLGQEMFESIHDIKFLPPGRGLWAMGSPITEERRLYAALNNCGFISTDMLKSNPVDPFVFLMDASMLGVGVGFDTLGAGQITIVDKNHSLGSLTYIIPDSREGWVEALSLLLRHYFVPGNHRPKFNYSLIRPAGEPIKGFGGVSGGPEPLRHALEEIDKILDASRGKAITVSNIVDIMNIIGKCIVSGNVRRTAEIAFGDPESTEFLDLKDYSKNPHREAFGWTSNNSIMATLGMDYKPIVDRIYKNGEPGLMWLGNMQQYSRMMESPDHKDRRAKGSNPCITGDTIILTSKGPKRADSLIHTPFDVVVNGKEYPSKSGMFITGYKPVYELKTKEGHKIRLTDDHLVRVATKITPSSRKKDWVEARNLKVGDFVILNKTRFMNSWEGEGNSNEGWLLGYFIGNGQLHNLSKTGTVTFCGDTRYKLRDIMLEKLRTVANASENSHTVKLCVVENSESVSISSVIFWDLCFKFGVDYNKKINFDICTSTSSSFQKGFLTGIFDSVGIIDHVCHTYIYLQLIADSQSYLRLIQTMLFNAGINSNIHTLNQSRFTLTVDSDNLHHFNLEIGFLNPVKDQFFHDLIDRYEQAPATERFIATVDSFRFVENAFVYDCTVEEIHMFSANGIIVHNCLEQTLESYELCCLVETFPERHQNLKEFLRTLELAFLYAKVVTLGPTHWPQTNKVMGRNRRIGTSLSGITQFIASRGMDTLKHWCIEGYNSIKIFDHVLSSQLGVPQSIKRTSIKPSGTVSLLAGATPGMHYPISKHYIRRVRVPSNSPLLKPLEKAGYFIEDAKDGMKGTTKVVEFPISVSDDSIPKLEDVSIWQQLSLAAFLQEYWADNSVSCTITFDPEKTTREEIATALDFYQYKLKGVSFLPNIKAGAYPQMPYEPIDEETYHQRMKDIHSIDWDATSKNFVETLRGYNANINILDEGLFIDTNIIKTIVLPVAQQRNSIIVALSTPQGTDAPSTRLFNTRRKGSDKTIFLIVRIGKPCDECRIKRILCLHVENATAEGLSKSKRELFLPFYEDDKETFMREFMAETCDDSRAIFSDELLLKLFSKKPEPVPHLVDMIIVGIDPAGGGKCEWGLCAAYFDTVKKIKVIVQLDAQRIPNPTPTVIRHWLKESIDSIRRRHSSFAEIPIVIACESAPQLIGEQLVEHIQMLTNEGLFHNTYLMYEISGSERPGVPKTEQTTQDMCRYASLLLTNDQIRFSKVFGTSVLGKKPMEAKLEYFKQVRNFKKRIDHYRKDGTAHFVINGKSNGMNDDLAVASLMIIYWYFIFMTSRKLMYENIRHQSSNWRFTHMTIDNFCNNARKRIRDDLNSSSSCSSHLSNCNDDDDSDIDEEISAKKHAAYADIESFGFKI